MPSPYPYGPLDVWGPNPRAALVGESDYLPLRAPLAPTLAERRAELEGRRIAALGRLEARAPLDIPHASDAYYPATPVGASETCEDCGETIPSESSWLGDYGCPVCYPDSAPVGDSDTAPLERADVVPGMRRLSDGRWYYSARWL
jgi:hypothetical protein